jgi:hypothetical protein
LVAAGLAACGRKPAPTPSESRFLFDRNDWLSALFGDWDLSPEPWPKAEARAGLTALELLLAGQNQDSTLPAIPAFPARPSLNGPTLDKLWNHLDLAAWRTLRFLNEPTIEPKVDREAHVLHLIQEGVGLLEQFHLMMLKAYTDHAASAQDYVEELASLLHRLHATLDTAAEAAGGDPLNWPIPDYTRFRGAPYALPKGPRGTTLPDSLAADLERALVSRQCGRPIATALPLVQTYGALKRAMDPAWTWSSSRDGRECAFILFESSMADLPDWSPTQARLFSRLCTALHAWSEGQPMPSHPSFDLDASDESHATLWRHLDLLFLMGSTLGIELGILGFPDAPSATKAQKRLREQWLEIQNLLRGVLVFWDEANSAERDGVMRLLPMALGACYQAFRNEIAKADRAFLPFLPKPPEGLLPRPKAPMVRFGRVKKR